MTTTETTTWVGAYGYYLTRQELTIVRKMARAARTSWQALAARPELAHAWVDCYREAGNDLDGALSRVLARVADGSMPV